MLSLTQEAGMTPVKALDPNLLAGLPPGTWVAISQDQERVVGSGSTVDQALQKAKENGEEKPYIIRVPLNNQALIL